MDRHALGKVIWITRLQVCVVVEEAAGTMTMKLAKFTEMLFCWALMLKVKDALLGQPVPEKATKLVIRAEAAWRGASSSSGPRLRGMAAASASGLVSGKGRGSGAGMATDRVKRKAEMIVRIVLVRNFMVVGG